jgi:hypothetical protein
VDLIVDFLSIHGNTSGGVIRTDLGGELAMSTAPQTTVFKETKYIIKPTGADSLLQNAGAEQLNQTLIITTQSLIYGSGLPACYWSADLLPAAYFHNCRVHSTKITPFEVWFGKCPDLHHLQVFGSRVCDKKSGEHQAKAKLDYHYFGGIFIGYTATDQNIRLFTRTPVWSSAPTMSSLIKHGICNPPGLH